MRGIGYHESVLGTLPDARALDALVPDRPLAMQHRSGRMWLLNSAALDALASADLRRGWSATGQASQAACSTKINGCATALGSTPPDFATFRPSLPA